MVPNVRRMSSSHAVLDTASESAPGASAVSAVSGASAAPGAGPGAGTADRRRWLALAVVMTAAFMDLVDVTIVNIAIPSMERDLGASFGAIQWVTAGYALAFAAGLITGGLLR